MSNKSERSPIYEQYAFDTQGNWQLPRRLYTAEDVTRLREALEPFVDLYHLRRLVADGEDIHASLRVDKSPREVRGLLATLSAMLRPPLQEQIKGPADVAALLIVEMSALDQEELRTVLLDTKNRVQEVYTIYRGSLNSATIRVGEVFKEALRRNSAALIVVHNHPSGSVEPSSEDLLITTQIIEAGQLLDCPCLDHIIIGKGKWSSLRERGKWVKERKQK